MSLRQKNVILYIDEIHTIIGSGSGSNGTLDGASLFLICFLQNQFDAWVLHMKNIPNILKKSCASSAFSEN